jgi:predicted nucleotidyltransferase
MNVEVPREKIAEFCRKWRVSELALFGSVLRDDFRPDSDVDVLLTFAPTPGSRSSTTSTCRTTWRRSSAARWTW